MIAPEWQAAVWVINPFLDHFKWNSDKTKKPKGATPQICFFSKMESLKKYVRASPSPLKHYVVLLHMRTDTARASSLI